MFLGERCGVYKGLPSSQDPCGANNNNECVMVAACGTPSEWGMRGWSVLGSVLLVGSGALVWSLLMARWVVPKAYTLFPLHWILKDRHNRPRHGSAGERRETQGRAGRAGSKMRGVLLVPSSSPALPPIYDGLDVSVTSNITWFHLNHDMVSRRIYELYFSGGHSITCPLYRRTNYCSIICVAV